MGTKRRREADELARTLESKLYIIRTSEGELADLSECGLRNVPTDFYNLCRVFRKELLDLHSNELSSLSADNNDEDLLRMDGILKGINISKNLFRIFPRSLLAIHSLIALNLSENQLIDLPDQIDALTNLEQLNLKGNRLQTIPGAIGNLTKLQKLDISSNFIRRLPLEISHLDHLEELYVDIEKLEFPSSSAFGDDVASLKRYFLAISPSGSRSLDSDAIMDECDRIPNEHSNCTNSTFEGNDLMRPLNVETVDDGSVAFDSEKANRERQIRLEQLAKEQEELDLLVAKVSEERFRDRQNVSDAVSQIESHAQSLIDNALNVLIGSSHTVKHDLEQDEIDALLHRRQIDLQQEHEEWLKLVEEEGLILSEVVCNETEERRRKSMEEIARKISETEALFIWKCDDKRRKLERICAEIANDQNVVEDFVVSMRERSDERSRVLQSQMGLIEKALVDISVMEIQRRNERTISNIKQLEDERHNLSTLYSHYVTERDFRRKQLLVQMRADMAKEEDSQRLIVAECLRRYAELITPPKLDRSPQRRSINGAERFGRFMALFGQKNKFERTPSPNKIVNYGAIKEKGLSPSSTITRPQTGLSSYSIVKALYEEECVVCMDKSVMLLISPCGHVCVCEQCGTSLEDCPLCRTHISNRILLSHA